MTRVEHLLTITAEECNEVAQRISKALRFGLKEIEPGQELTNAERIAQEAQEVVAMLAMLEEVGVIDMGGNTHLEKRCMEKRQKVEQFLRYSQSCGTLTDSEA